MKKFLVLFIMVLEISINAQPYIYYSTKVIDTKFGTLEKIIRYNIASNCVEDFLPDQILGESAGCIWDNTQSFLVIDLLRDGFKIYNCSNTKVYYDLGYWGSQINQMLFSKKRNKLFLFSDDYKKISVFSISADSISFEYNYLLGNESYDTDLTNPSCTASFSSDGNQIFIFNFDSNEISQVWTFSIVNNQIIQKINLAELGYSGSDGYDLRFGKKGKGILTSYPSYNNPNRDFYYRIYDFDNKTGSDFIYHNGLSEAYFANDGDLILIMNTFKDDSTLEYYHTGEGFIYNTKNAQLIERVHLPSKGKIYSFDAEQQNLYYVKDIESDNREIYLISFDSSVDEPKVKELFSK